MGNQTETLTTHQLHSKHGKKGGSADAVPPLIGLPPVLILFQRIKPGDSKVLNANPYL